MEVLKLDSYIAVNSFVKDEKRRYIGKVISLKQITEKNYFDSLTQFEEVFHAYQAYFHENNHKSVNRHAALVSKLQSATKNLLISFEKQHHMRKCSSDMNLLFLSIIKDMKTSIELSEYFFNTLALAAMEDVEISSIPTLDCEMENFSFGEHKK